MEKAYAIIGANWGDEGKGLATDALSHQLQTAGAQVLVLRSNGGAQAGHGVTREGGKRHVFHHIGSGALAGAATHLSRFFVANPIVFHEEYQALQDLGGNLDISIDPGCRVTTPWDMILNQQVEIMRGGGRHGSCGLGFGETIARHEAGFPLTIADLQRPEHELRAILEQIIALWAPARAHALGLDPEKSDLAALLHNQGIRAHFLNDCTRFLALVKPVPDPIAAQGRRVIFEGAQGLQLDMDYGAMPHVTRSNTGLKNMLALAQIMGITHLTPIYLTRCYATRHGAGPLPHEDDPALPMDWTEVTDLTNAANEWQGKIRHAPLDLTILTAAVRHDLALADPAQITLSPMLAVTCLDQMTGEAVLIDADGPDHVPKSIVARPIATATGLPLAFSSFGPMREDVRWSVGIL